MWAVVAAAAASGFVIVAAVCPLHAQTVCTATQIAQLSGCPSNAPSCSITATFEVGNGCVLDFGTRSVTLSGTLDIADGAVSIKAGSLTITPSGLIDGRATAAASPGIGGMITIETTGTVTVQKAVARGRISVAGKTTGGTIVINAGSDVVIAGALEADNANTTTSSGGNIVICAGGSITTSGGSLMTVKGGTQSGGGGDVDLMAGGAIVLGEEIDISGSDGGSLDVFAGDAVTMDRIQANGTGDAGSGGDIDVTGGTSVRLTKKFVVDGNFSIFDTTGGCGGMVSVEADYGDLTIEAGGDISAEGAVADGAGGDIDLTSQGNMVIQSGVTISARGNGSEGCGGFMCLQPRLTLTHAGLLDASGGAGFGEIGIVGGTTVILNGDVRVDARNNGGDGGIADVAAGTEGTGALTVAGTINATGGGCGQEAGCGAGGSTELSGSNVTVTTTGRLLATGPDGGQNDLTANEQLTISGTVDATKTRSDGADGFNTIEYPARKPAVISPGAMTPDPDRIIRSTCLSDLDTNCLVPAPVCGNGVVEFPETCDSTLSCAGCSVFCQLENCDDDLECTIDSCAPALGCRHLDAPSPCVEGGTPTPTQTLTRTPTPTWTETPPPTVTRTPSATASPTATPTRTRTASPTLTPSRTATGTATSTATLGPPTPTPTGSATPTPPSTPSAPGDANCDGQITGADEPAVLTLILGQLPIQCGADVESDGVLDERDVAAIVQLIFADPR